MSEYMIDANAAIIVAAILLDLVALGAFLWVKASSDLLIVVVSALMVIVIFAGEKWFLQTLPGEN